MKYKYLLIIATTLLLFTSCRKDFPRQMAISINSETHTTNSVSFSLNVADLGGNKTVEYGVCYSASNVTPTISDSKVYKTSTTTGSNTIEVTGLSSGLTYHFRAFIKVSDIVYTSSIDILTHSKLPIVTTNAISNIMATTVTCGGNVTSDGGDAVTARGVCWSVSSNPVATGSHTTNGTGTGSFVSSITGLTASTLYYVRAYATNSVGTSYGSQVSFTTSIGNLGQSYQGGIIFYIDGTGQHGLISATTDQSTGAEWGCYGTAIGGTSTAISTGQANTTAIVNGCSTSGIAARLCNDLVLNGYNDWFLPSKDELNLMYVNLKVSGLGGFASNGYWSTSEIDATNAWIHNFGNGFQINYIKDFPYYVRAVRAF